MLACLVSQIAAGDVNSGRRVIRGSATADPLFRRAKAYMLKQFAAPEFVVGNRSPADFDQRAPFGVCGLLALPKIHQIFGDSPAKYPRLCVCDEVRAFSS